MLLSFTVSNFRSFREEQAFSMVASNYQKDHADHLSPIPDDNNKTLPVAAIYGANGAGKTNLVKALNFLKTLVVQGTEPKKAISRQPFLLDKTGTSDPTEFKVLFCQGSHVFQYGVRVSDTHVLAEWLLLVRNTKEIVVFERATDEAGNVKVKCGPVLTEDTWGNHRTVAALAQVGALENQLFLHAISKTVRETHQGPIIEAVLSWFLNRLVIVGANTTVANLIEVISRDLSFTDFAGRFLRDVATGVDTLRADTIEIDETTLASLGWAPRIQEAFNNLEPGHTMVVPSADGWSAQLILEKGEDNKVRVRTLVAEHRTTDGSRMNLPFAEESDGTQRLVHLLPALYRPVSYPCVFVIDEIDRSLHPLLSKGFVREFLKLCGGAGKGNQLIFTTHDTAFLDLDLLRRDEIWFAEKKPGKSATELYSLADFKVRTDLKIDKSYMQGRFGAVPPSQAEFPDWVNKIIAELKQPRADNDSGADGNDTKP